MTGKNKEMIYTETKGIRLTEEQAKNWNPKKIRKFLENANDNIDTQILKKLIIPFAKNGIKVDLGPKEISRIKKLMEMVNQDA